MAILYKQAHEEAEPLQKVVPNLSPEIAEVIHNAIKKDASERYPSAKAFADALQGQPKTTNTKPWLGLAILTVVASVLFLVLADKKAPTQTEFAIDAAIPSAKIEPEVPKAPEPSPEVKPERIKVEFEAVVPRKIQLVFEDGRKEDTPYSLERDKGSEAIKFVAKAKGYQPQSFQVTFDRNAYHQIVLKRKRRALPKKPSFEPLEY